MRDFKAVFTLHSYGEGRRDYEIIGDISFPEIDKRISELTRQIALIPRNEKKREYIYREIATLDMYRDILYEDLGDFGEISEKIHTELWKKNQTENDYTISAALSYSDYRGPYTGKVDTDISYTYEVTNMQQTAEKEDIERD